jgi:DNA-binding NtrC family response regulator
MPFMTSDERAFAHAISELAVSNPFLPERIEIERKILGRHFIPRGTVWHARQDLVERNPNLPLFTERVDALVTTLRERLGAGARPSPEDRVLYEELVAYLLFYRAEPELYELITSRAPAARVAGFARFARDVQRYLDLPALAAPARASSTPASPAPAGASAAPTPLDPAQLFAFFFQIRRAFHVTIENIIGGSLPAAQLRAAVWQATFTRDMRRYRRALYRRMQDITTLIVGPSGTGKELVAQAVAQSRYIPFDAATQRFAEDFRESFYALSISALPSTLVESELFGHRRGAFTGAVEDRPGWLEVCPPLGAVFLDEIAEIDAAIQVKLLRVLQNRTFQRVGDTHERRFQGRIVAATNRDLATEMQAGRFRPDLYYRLCADVIETPSLDAQLRDDPGELRHLLHFLAGRIAGEAEADALAEETERWIRDHLGPGYRWPGNVRELEQCVRNVMIRGEYRPPQRAAAADGVRERLAGAFVGGSFTVDELLRRYCTLVFARTGSYVETARRLAIDRRTVKDKVDPVLLEQLKGEDPRA